MSDEPRLRVFLCHASQDKAAVRELRAQLQAVGAEPWLDEDQILPGHDWEQEIARAVRSSHVVLVCLSRSSINKEGYVQKEIRLALDIADEKPDGTIFVIPARIEECEVPARLRRWAWVDLFAANGCQRLIEAVRSRAASLAQRTSFARDTARQLTSEIARMLDGENQRVLAEAGSRIGRKLEGWQALDQLFIPIRLARGLRPNFTQTEYEALEQQRRGAASRTTARHLDHNSGEIKERERPVVKWEDVRTGLHRAVILGDPGFGKTMLLWHEVTRRNELWLKKSRSGSTETTEVEVAVFISASELARAIEDDSKEGVLEYLLTQLFARWDLSPEAARLVRQKLIEGAGMIAIDALDEVPITSRARFEQALNTLGQRYQSLKLLLSSRLVGYIAAPTNVPKDNEFEVMPFQTSQMRRLVETWFSPDSKLSSVVWQSIHTQDSVKADLRSPLLLRLACQLTEATKLRDENLPRWNRRGEMYQAFVRELVWQWGVKAGAGMEASDLFPEFAADVCLNLWKLDARRTLWERRTVAAQVNALRVNYGALAARHDLVGDLCSTGIFTLAGPSGRDTPLMYTHRTFGEYLAGHALGCRLNNLGAPEWKLLDRKTWDPNWQEVLVFATGHLDSGPAGKLLGVLEDRSSDDVFRHRLALASFCLRELRPKFYSQLGSLIDAITSAVFDLWSEEHRAHRGSLTPHLGEALPTLASIDAVADRGFLRKVMTSDVWEDALEEMGTAAATQQVFSQLIALLSAPEASLQRKAVYGLQAIGASDKALPQVLDTLITSLNDNRSGVRAWAAETLGNMKRAVVSRSDVGIQLVKLIGDEEDEVREAAEQALLGMAGTLFQQQKVIDELLTFLDHDGSEAMAVAIEILGEIADRSAKWPGVVPRLVALLHNWKRDVRFIAASTLGKMGATVSRRPRVVQGLLQLLEDRDTSVRLEAVTAIGRMGRSVYGRSGVSERLIALLNDPEARVQAEAAKSLATLGLKDVPP
jgi:HEAT repeat protein